MKKIFGLFALILFIPRSAFAHCPLCTIGAGAAAAGAAWLGVSYVVIGLFLGAFSLALGLWIGKMIKKQYVRNQTILLGILSFVTTIFPLRPMLKSYTSLNVYWFGEYGSLFYRTYLVDLFLVGAFLGAVVLLISPWASRQIAKKRDGKMIPYQGMIISFGSLTVLGLIFQFVI